MKAGRGTAFGIGAVVVLAVAGALLLGWRLLAADGVHRLGEGDDGGVVEVAVGEEITLTLEGNPTTGYEWQVTGIDPAVLAADGDPEYRSSSDADGAGGVYTFGFRAVAAGETTLELAYFRSWEGPAPDDRRFTVTVVVG